MTSEEREHGAFEARITNLEKQVVRIETKIDQLLDFRGWMLGGVAAVSAAISVAIAFLFKR